LILYRTYLNLRQIYYPHTANNQTNGGTIIAAYTSGDSSILWQSLSDSEAIKLALKQLIQLHKSSSNLRDYIQGAKFQHWWEDPHAHGTYVMLAPLQETSRGGATGGRGGGGTPPAFRKFKQNFLRFCQKLI
jgi:monoamine oxidase